MNGTPDRFVAGIVATCSTVWTMAGTGDFNGDGMSDILWQDNSGDIAVWLMNGVTISAAGGSPTFRTPGGWPKPATSTATA